MRPWMALLGLLGLLAPAPACGFRSSGNGGMIDGGIDAPKCFGTIFQICFPASKVPTTPRVLTAGLTQIDTDMTDPGSACDQNNDQNAKYCVVAAAGLMLPADAMLTAHGTKPLVLLSTTTMELLGSIDVSSHQTGGAQLRGAGASPTDPACASATPPTGGGGGAGGSFGSPGGGGGDQGMPAAGGGKAGSALDRFPAALRGGCKGDEGSAPGGSPAAGGDGGGAIDLIAAMQIHVDATINASGGGAQGGAMGPTNGGGGGGSGGMIVLDSTQPLMFGPNVKLWANGGSGGQGGSTTADGAAGGESSSPMARALGANGSGTGGAGGDGSVGTGFGGKGVNASIGGAGGGGGGGGFIHAPGHDPTSMISPPSSDPPPPPPPAP